MLDREAFICFLAAMGSTCNVILSITFTLPLLQYPMIILSGGFRWLLVTLAGLLPLTATISLAPEGYGCCLTVLVQA